MVVRIFDGTAFPTRLESLRTGGGGQVLSDQAWLSLAMAGIEAG